MCDTALLLRNAYVCGRGLQTKDDNRLLIDPPVAPQTEAHKARAAEVEQLRRELADAQAVAALRVAGGASAPLSLRSGGAAASGDGGPGSNQGSMPVTPTASWTQVRPLVTVQSMSHSQMERFTGGRRVALPHVNQ